MIEWDVFRRKGCDTVLETLIANRSAANDTCETRDRLELGLLLIAGAGEFRLAFFEPRIVVLCQ